MILEGRARRRAELALLGLLAVVRAPGFAFGPVDVDETDFLLVGRLLRAGAIPYVDVVEKKPPLSYLFYSPAALFGFHLWPVQLLALVWLWATCVVVGRAARRLSGRDDVGLVAAALCAAVSACNVLSVNAELMLNLPAACALACFARRERGGRARNDLATGLSVGAAMQFKHQAGMLLVALGLAILARRRDEPLGGVRARMSRLALLGTGAALPWAAAAGVYAALGHLDALWEWNVARNFLYVGGYQPGSPLARFAESTLLFAAVAAPLPWLAAARATPRLLREPAGRGVALALWSTWAPVCLGGRFYGHYYLQFAPSLALAAAPSVAALLEAPARRRRVALALAAPVAGFALFAVARGLLGTYPAQEPRTIAVAAWLRAHTRPDERLFVWGHYTPIYYLAERLPGTRYYNTSVHMGDFDPHHLPPGFDVTPYRSARDVANTVRDLDERRPEFVVDTAPADIHDWSRVPLARFPEIARYVEEHYERVAVVAGAPIYRRRSETLTNRQPDD
jgi:hypothetical protein